MVNWIAMDPGATFEISKERLTLAFDGMNIPRDQWYMYILQQIGDEDWKHLHNSMKNKVEKRGPDQICRAFKKI